MEHHDGAGTTMAVAAVRTLAWRVSGESRAGKPAPHRGGASVDQLATFRGLHRRFAARL
jgi:hypothetical protein